MQLFHNPDGANYQARTVLAILQSRNIDDCYNSDRHCYEYGDIFSKGPQVDRWQNCREQGYVIHWRVKGKQLNIAFFEHRNSDEICAVEWEQLTMNAPTIDTMEANGVYATKWDVSKSVHVGQYDAMADWIMERLTAFWKSSRKPELVTPTSEQL